MSRINEIIASMPPGEAAAVVHLREVHACLMDIDKNHARTLAAKGEKVTVETYFSYINRVH